MKPISSGLGKDQNNTFHSSFFRWLFNLKSITIILVLSLLSYLFLSDILGGKEVSFVTAIALPAEDGRTNELKSSPTRGDLIFQASGWIEPDPFPIRITSLYSGVVKEVHILEGEKVTKNQVLVTLIEEDAQLANKEARANLAKAQAEAEALNIELELAVARKQSAIHALGKDHALLRESNDTLDRLQNLPEGAVADLEISQARFRMERQNSLYLGAKAIVIENEVGIRLLQEKLKVQQAIISSFEVALETTQLNLSRTKIKSTIDGIVLRLLASPGSRMMLNMDKPDASTAAILYEEGKLQARIDVPLSEAAQIFKGQVVSISSGLLPEKSFEGKVTRIVGEADLQRNTLQVKVSIEKPDVRLKPEMLCRAKFFADAVSSGTENKPDLLEVYLPREIQDNKNQSKQNLWVLSDDGKRAESREVVFGNRQKEGFVSVVSGLNPGDQVIRDPPKDIKIGDFVRKLDD